MLSSQRAEIFRAAGYSAALKTMKKLGVFHLIPGLSDDEPDCESESDLGASENREWRLRSVLVDTIYNQLS